MRLKSALRRGVAAAVIAGIVVSSGIPAYAKTWNIADGDITVKGASDESGNYNNVKQGEKDFEKDEGETVITGESDKNTVTIDTSEGNVDVTFDDLKIDVSGKKEGDGSGKRIINPQTHVEAEENAYIEMDTVQLKGVDSTKRVSSAKLGPGATIVIKEKIMTHGHQTAETSFDVSLDGAGSSAKLISRSVARDFSRQLFRSKIIGNTDCYGHSECDAIIMDNGVVAAEPEIIANHVDASLVHEAAIGKIAGDQLVKLMTLGLTENEAEAQIINGFLK